MADTVLKVATMADIEKVAASDKHIGDVAFDMSDFTEYFFGNDDAPFVELVTPQPQAFGDFLVAGQPVRVSLVYVDVSERGEVFVTPALGAEGKISAGDIEKALGGFLKKHGRRYEGEKEENDKEDDKDGREDVEKDEN